MLPGIQIAEVFLKPRCSLRAIHERERVHADHNDRETFCAGHSSHKFIWEASIAGHNNPSVTFHQLEQRSTRLHPSV